MQHFVDVYRDTLYLLPPSIPEWLPEMLARFYFTGTPRKFFQIQSLRVAPMTQWLSYIGDNSRPDNDTIAKFRRCFLPELTKLFVDILAVVHEMKTNKYGRFLRLEFSPVQPSTDTNASIPAFL